MKSFSSSALHPAIIKELEIRDIVVPTAIQARTIPLLLSHKGDFVGRSATGTGKTIAFGAPLLSRIDITSGSVQAVVLVPTRELCEQVGNELIDLGKGIKGLKVEAVYGGVSMKAQIRDLSNGVQVIVATPGRLMDLVGRKVVDLSTLDFVIFDEADEMLLKGFRTDVDKILAAAKRNYATWLFSATMPQEVGAIINKYLNKSLEKIQIGQLKSPNVAIKHQEIQVIPEEKLDVLLHFLNRFGDLKGMIFCRTKSGVQKLYKHLSAHKLSSGAIHGDLPQGLRNKVMEQYRDGHINLLIATDVAARGVDVVDVAFVIQYQPADTSEAYTHRSGRTSRVGNAGVSLTFVFAEEKEKWEAVKENLTISIESLALPSPKDQLVNRAILWGRKIAKEKPVGDALSAQEQQPFKEALGHLSKEELLDKLLANYLREHQG